jgi:hypothetical protein
MFWQTPDLSFGFAKKRVSFIISFVLKDGDDVPNPHWANLQNVIGNKRGQIPL